MIRKPCVSGLFYESDEDLLLKNIESLMSETDSSTELEEVVAGIAPHAGYIYSGKTAAYTFNEIKNHIPETFIILGPNHTGYGTRIDVCDYDKWETPLGLIDVDTEFINELLNVNPDVYVDNSAHKNEHSIEVELPFIQYISRNHPIKIVPIVISRQIPELCERLADSLNIVIEKLERDCVVIASTDLTHYEDIDTANYFDSKIIESVEDINMSQMIKDIIEYDITMCGYGPVITAMNLAKIQNYEDSIVLNHSTSGDVSGDYESVVGYMSAVTGKRPL